MLNFKSIAQQLSGFKPKRLPETQQQAAVMLLLLTNNTNPIEIVITKRANSLSTYSGHYSFPGGMRDPSDASLYVTATRETQEELNLPPAAYQYIGELDDFMDNNNNLVRPFVAIMKKADFEKNHVAARDEIASVYYFSINKLDAIKDNPELHAITRRRPSYAFTENGVVIWGLTATILVHFYNIIAGKNLSLGKRVSSFPPKRESP